MTEPKPAHETPPPAGLGSSDLFGSSVWTAEALLRNAYLSNIERWWEAWKDGKHHQFVRVRLDIKKQEYVLDAVGQSLQHSEELWRYKHGGWTFRSALANAEVCQPHREPTEPKEKNERTTTNSRNAPDCGAWQ